MVGITAYGACLPRLRLDRMAVFRQMGWLAPAVVMVAQGERAFCNWDEDAVTLAVAAARDCLTGMERSQVEALYLASTTLPFADRQNAGIVAAALNLPETILTADFAASQKAGTTALLTALESVGSGGRDTVLVAAADRRETRTAYFYEMWFGDGAAALTVGRRDVIAEFESAHTISCDFVDHYRGAGKRFDYVWEERWVRDEGYSQIIPQAVEGLLEKLDLSIESVDRLVYPCFFQREHGRIARRLGADPKKVADNLHTVCGETGAAHPLLMLTAALEQASPGERIVVAGFGQGANALSFRVTEKIRDLAPRRGFSGWLENGQTTDNYLKFLKFRDLIDTEMGIRAEAPTQTAMTALWRRRQMLLGLVGGRCRTCGTPQFPRSPVCVNPDCGALHSQEDYGFSERPARIKTFTGDLLAVSVDPPHAYGMIQFEGGGRFMADFTDCDFGTLRVGQAVQMVFRRRTADPRRGFVNYFWKAVPVAADETAAAETIRFDDQVAVITGAGGGLGRAYALELARRGARVVVNDLGGARDGSGEGQPGPADRVVEEIRAAGGQAVANYDNVATPEGGERIVRTALDAWGRIDVLVNNAGILRDKSLAKMEPETWQAVLSVHLDGAYHVSRPAFAAMRAAGRGRIVMTTSAAGLYGNFGQTNYAAAKMGVVGLMNTLRIEGEKYGLRVNAVAPLAASRLTEDVMPPDIFARLEPEFVVPLVVYLCSEHCTVSGQVFNAGGGVFSRAAVLTGAGVRLGDSDRPPTVEQVKARWESIRSLDQGREVGSALDAVLALAQPPEAAPEREEEAGAAESGPPGVAAVFERMPDAFRPQAAAGVEAVFQYHIGGTGGGDWYCAVGEGACTVGAGRHDAPTCSLHMAAEDFLDMIAGKLPAMQAYTSGKLRIEGDILKSQLIEKLFDLSAAR